MNFSKIFIATITLFFASFSFVSATTPVELEKTPIEEQVIKGGPRDVVQTMVDVTIFQPTQTNLYINIINSENVIVIEHSTQAEKTVLSTVELKAGNYVIETVDDYGDYQEFVITIE